jgi:hypothetical protein
MLIARYCRTRGVVWRLHEYSCILREWAGATFSASLAALANQTRARCWNSKRKNSPGWIINEIGCDIWHGNRTKKGYALVMVGRRQCLVYRVRYEREIGPIPDGMVLDHYVCDNGAGGCCNPHHCRPVTTRENLLRGNTLQSRNAAKTCCPKCGGPFTRSRVGRYCRPCINAAARIRRAHNPIVRGLTMTDRDAGPTP